MIESPNASRFSPGRTEGFYESFFCRANHPELSEAFWIRYTLFAPRGRPDDAVGELWAVFFDGESRNHVAVKEVHPISQCSFDRNQLHARVGEAVLTEGALRGTATSSGSTIGWDLQYDGAERPLLLLPPALYRTPLPKAKALVPLPQASFTGTLRVGSREFDIRDWVGSQNHNWGSKHTDRYAWAQVAGFDDSPDTFVELATAQIRVGPLWTPPLTPIVLRHDGEELRLNSLWQSARNKGWAHGGRMTFSADDGDVRVDGFVQASADAFVGLRYDNPPGGFKVCNNSKIARCQLTITRSGRSKTLRTQHRAAFEVLDDEPLAGVSVRV